MAQTHMYRVKESKHIKQNWEKKSVLKQTWTNKEHEKQNPKQISKYSFYVTFMLSALLEN